MKKQYISPVICPVSVQSTNLILNVSPGSGTGTGEGAGFGGGADPENPSPWD